ncbi:polyphosphate kinase 2 family protein [Methanoregula sp.]|uniref:polyphosphate kinase 2 family protein n=1 Tax=Methanoregula sp. TaxID=2052170 RepID=UPI002C70B8BA|nr:polyphosphate kinase 2 family protein [Methanoregula sp.]HVP96426.1 polyphosphate kinase 2 family protein [Methanoregula sp.]
MDVNGPQVRKYLRQFVAEPKKKVRLKNYDTAWVPREELKIENEDEIRDQLRTLLEKNRMELAKAQELLAASRQYSILIVLQGMDTSGKDGTIRHVMSGVNPQGCSVHSFKVPGDEEHAHDFLWRYERVLPERGMIGIFNRSYYEDVLVVRVHPDRMEELPPAIGSGADGFWEGRFKDINAFEKHLVRNGTVILKFFLHLSRDEQKRRLLDRLSHTEKYWKFSFTDIAERQYWDQYQVAYEEMLAATSTTYAPWFIVPADHKWVARTAVAEVITSAIEGLHLSYPAFSDERLQELSKAKKDLEQE